jgi:excisionase family DNA binding protein
MIEPETPAAEAPAAVEYLTPTEVGTLLRVTKKSVYRWAAEDPTMPALRIGGTLRFSRTRLEVWLRSREQGRGRGRPRLAVVKDPESSPR